MEILIEAFWGTLSLLARLGPIMFLSLYSTELLIQLGFMRKLAIIGKPLTQLSRLPPISAVTFLAGLGSLIAANTMLAAFRKEGRLSGREVVMTSLLNSMPAYVREVFTYQIPVVIPMLGIRIGVIHIMTFWLAGLMKMVFIVVGGRLLLNFGKPASKDKNPGAAFNLPKAVPLKDALAQAFHAQKKTFLKIIRIYAGMTFLVLACSKAGLFNGLNKLALPITSHFGLPPSAAGAIAAYGVSPTVGMASLSSLLNGGHISEYQVILALLIGGFLMIPLVHLRHMLPKYISFFGGKIGLIIIGLSLAFSLTARTIMLAVVIAIYG